MDISFWLIPEENQKKIFEKIIQELSKKYKSYSFIPHITLFYIPKIKKNGLTYIIKISNELLEKQKKLSLDFVDINYSNIFTKTLYCQYKINKELNDLYQKFYEKFKTYNNYQINPHLSLIYKNKMKDDDKIKEKNQLIKIISQKLTLTQFALIKGNKTIGKEKDVLNWKLIFEKKLF